MCENGHNGLVSSNCLAEFTGLFARTVSSSVAYCFVVLSREQKYVYKGLWKLVLRTCEIKTFILIKFSFSVPVNSQRLLVRGFITVIARV